MRIAIARLALACVLTASAATAALAQSAADYPNHVVRIIVPYPPGGGPDLFTRLVAQKLGDAWKQPVVVENRIGGMGNTGASHVAHSDPDGYTLMAAAPGPIAINGSLFKDLTYDPAEWTPVTILTRQPMVLGARKDLPGGTLPKFLALAKASPGKFSYGSLGFGSMSQLTMVEFLSMAGVNLLHVPYTGSSPALVALMTGQVDIVFDNPVTYVPAFRNGQIKVLAAGASSRLSLLPETPSFAEAGFPGLRPYAWLAVVAPPKTPSAIVERISKAMADALALPDVKKKLETFATEPVASTPAETGKFLAEERAKWRAVVESAKLSVN